jgi:hypothetical protein
MAREIQSQSSRSQGARGFLAPLANAVFWLVLAIALPIDSFLRTIPELAALAPFGPILFYALAFFSFVRALRNLQRLAAGRPWAPRLGLSGPGQAQRSAGNPRTPGKRARPGLAATVTRAPTVQRMR